MTEGDHLVDLNTRLDPVSGAGWLIQNALDINNAGQIVAWGKLGVDPAQRSVLLTPMP